MGTARPGHGDCRVEPGAAASCTHGHIDWTMPTRIGVLVCQLVLLEVHHVHTCEETQSDLRNTPTLVCHAVGSAVGC